MGIPDHLTCLLRKLYVCQEVRVYLWRTHFDIWQNQYNIVKFKNKIKLKHTHTQSLGIVKNIILLSGFLFPQHFKVNPLKADATFLQ